MNRFAILALTVGSMFSASQAFGITLGQVDDFNDGSLENWETGGINPNPHVNVADAGQAGVGDHVMRLEANGELGGPGSQAAVYNFGQWTGDYISAGVTAIEIDINNVGNNPINSGFEIRGAGGNLYTLAGASVPANSGWVTVTISLDPSNLVGGDALATLGAVSELRIRDIVGGTTVKVWWGGFCNIT